jgi:hypothetical protein
MRSLRIALAAVAVAGTVVLPASTASASEPIVGICSYDIDWGYVPELLAALPAGAGGVVGAAICRI